MYTCLYFFYSSYSFFTALPRSSLPFRKKAGLILQGTNQLLTTDANCYDGTRGSSLDAPFTLLLPHLTTLLFDMNGAIIYYRLFFLRSTLFFHASGINSGSTGFFPGDPVHKPENVLAVIGNRDDQIINTQYHREKYDELVPGNFF